MAYYLAGPMRGLPNSNFPAFDEAREHLRSFGFDVLCPVEDASQRFSAGIAADDTNYHAQMWHCFEMVQRSEGVIVLPGWARSVGAKAEVLVAVNTGKPVFAYHKHRPRAQVLEELVGLNISTTAERL